MYGERTRSWKNMVVACSRVILQHFFEEFLRATKELRIALLEIRNRCLKNVVSIVISTLVLPVNLWLMVKGKCLHNTRRTIKGPDVWFFVGSKYLCSCCKRCYGKPLKIYEYQKGFRIETSEIMYWISVKGWKEWEPKNRHFRSSFCEC
jgi:hypothetical protein